MVQVFNWKIPHLFEKKFHQTSILAFEFFISWLKAKLTRQTTVSWLGNVIKGENYYQKRKQNYTKKGNERYEDEFSKTSYLIGTVLCFWLCMLWAPSHPALYVQNNWLLSLDKLGIKHYIKKSHKNLDFIILWVKLDTLS